MAIISIGVGHCVGSKKARAGHDAVLRDSIRAALCDRAWHGVGVSEGVERAPREVPQPACRRRLTGAGCGLSCGCSAVEHDFVANRASPAPLTCPPAAACVCCISGVSALSSPVTISRVMDPLGPPVSPFCVCGFGVLRCLGCRGGCVEVQASRATDQSARSAAADTAKCQFDFAVL